MNDSKKTKQQLIKELAEARHKIAAMANSEDKSHETPHNSLEMDNIFRKAFFTSPDMFIIANPENGTYVEANESFIRATGYSREELIGRSVDEIQLWEYPEELDKMNRLLAEQGKVTDEEFHFRMKSGEIRQWLCSSELVPIGENNYMIAVSTDITERKRAEESLRKSEEQFRSSLDDSPMGIRIIDAEGDETVYANKAILDLYGYDSLKELKETPAEQRYTPQSYAEYRASREKRKRSSKDAPLRYELSIVRKDGEIRELEAVVKEMLWDGKKHSQVIYNDITERKRAEMELVTAQEKLREAHRLAHIGTWDLVIETDKVTWSEELYRIVGWDPSRPTPPSSELQHLYTPDSWNRLNSAITKADTTGEPYELELEIIRPDGITRWVNEFGGVMRDGNGDIIGFHGTLQDITERKQAEEKHETIIKTTLDGFWMTDLTGKFLEVNDSYCTLVDYTQEELLNMSISDIEAIDNPGDILERINRIVNFGPERFETKHRRKDGQIIDVEINTSYLEGAGQISVFVRNITERKQVEEALRESEEKYRTVIDNADIGIIVVRDNRLVFSNPWIHKMLGYTKDQLYKSDIISFVHPDDKLVISELMNDFLIGKSTSYSIEMRVFSKSGEIMWIEGSSVLIQWQGKPAIQSFIIDITERKQVEEALRESEERFRTLFETMAQGVVYQDADGNIISANPAAQDILGLTLDQMMGRTSSDSRWKTIHEDGSDLPGEQHPAMVSLRTGKPVNDVNMGIFHPIRNEYRWLIVNAFPEFKEGEDTPYRVCSTFSDVTGRRHAQDAIRQSEEKFSKAFRASPDSITITTLREGRIIDVNDSYQQLSGYTREDVIGKTTADLQTWVVPEEREKIMNILNKEGSVKNCELKFLKKSGEIHEVLFSAESIEIDGEPCIISITNDITERKRAEEALQESEAELQGILRAAPIGIALVKDRVALWANDYFCKMTGYSSEELVGMNSRMLYLTEEEFIRVGQIYTEQIELYGKGEVETRLVCKNGDIIDALLISTPLNPNDPSGGIIATFMDITERKKAQEQESETQNLRELDRLRTELLANVSHELRTPLASIKGFTTVMMDYDNKLKSDEKREYLEIIDNNTDRLSELIEQLLVMSRLGAGMLTIEKEPNNINRLCRDVIAEARVRTPDYQFMLDLPARLPKAHIDGKRIRQVLDNLIDNAVKHSSSGSKITISARKDTDMILMTITDEGSGILQKDQSRIFDRMFHAERKHKPGISGAGLGLSICKGLVEAHDGRIWIESEEGKGTRCFFTLPIYKSRGDSHGKKDKGQYHSMHRR